MVAHCPEKDKALPVPSMEELRAITPSLLTHIFNTGYMRGHHDTVEGTFVDIHTLDMDTYHGEDVAELVEELME